MPRIATTIIGAVAAARIERGAAGAQRTFPPGPSS